MARKSYAFRVRCDPPDPSFRHQPAEVRRWYYGQVKALVLAAKEKDILQGIDAHGEHFVRLAQSTIEHRHSAMGPADPNAPPLIPAHGLSRTAALLDARAHEDHVECFWRVDPVTGLHWGRILGFHRDGQGRWGPIPQRDAIGLSPQRFAEVRDAAHQLWYHYRVHHAASVATARRIAAGEAGEPLPIGGHPPHAVPPPPHRPTPPPRPPATPLEIRAQRGPVPKIPLTGRTDFENMTGGAFADVESSRRAVAEGYSSGVSRLTKGGNAYINRPPGSGPAPAGGSPPPRGKGPKPAAAARSKSSRRWQPTSGVTIEVKNAHLLNQ